MANDRLDLRQPFGMPAGQKHVFDTVHAVNTNVISELYQSGWFQNLAALKTAKATKALPVGILMKLFNGTFIKAVVVMLEQLKPDHQTDRLRMPAQRGVVNRQLLVELKPVNELGGAQQFVARI